MNGQQPKGPGAERAAGGDVFPLTLGGDDATDTAGNDRPTDETEDADEQQKHIARR